MASAGGSCWSTRRRAPASRPSITPGSPPRLPPPPGNRSTLRPCRSWPSSWPGTPWSSTRSASIGAAAWTATPASGPSSRRRATRWRCRHPTRRSRCPSGGTTCGRSLADGREWALTTDGEPDYQYGSGPDCTSNGTLLRKFGLPRLPPAVAWSPDSTKVLAHRTDERGVRQTHLVEARPADGGAPVLRTQRYAYPGDENMPQAELVVLDVSEGTVVRAQAEPLLMPQSSPITTKWAWWAPDGSAVYYLGQRRDLRTLALHRLEPATGEVTTVLSETGTTRVEPNQWMYEPPIVRVLADEVLWYSQRDGWGHLYRYDLRTGELLGQVTSGQWAVRQILQVEEAERVVYFTVSGLVDEDPYRRTVCRVGLDGSGLAKVTDDELDHIVTMPDTMEYFIDSASTVDTPPVTTVRDWSGRVLVELERADITKLTL